MTEIRFHGRGGQGAVIASRILALAAFKEGRNVQAFPFFGVERRGAPVTAFTRIASREIRIRSQIYQPDCVIVLDPGLLKTVDITRGMKKNSVILINSEHSPSWFKFGLSNDKVFTVDAQTVALKYGLGSPASPIVNTAVLGAFAGISPEVRIYSIIGSIEEYVFIKTKQNVMAAKEAYGLIKKG
ncbi:MAG: 2-oxoacid:acceptor oxidoreductase family protein [Candidatus Omnitrophota bacterium]|nr:2-oxoacid:acceptor oxidoreductase family protein [Candidatus Omnitrophota bacterium]